MSALYKVHGVSKQLFHLVSQPIEKEERDECIQKITSLLDEREQLLADVRPPFTKNDHDLLEQIVNWNKIITTKFTVIKQQIQLDITQLKKTQQSQQQYVNPYQNISTTDGMYYDKRK